MSKLCEETYDDHEQWMKLIELLEKDMKVQQQRMLIQEKSDEKRNTKQNSDDRQIGKNGAHFTNQSTEKKCHFCDETDDHIATVGPRRTEIIQYFACNKFVEMDTKGKVSRAQTKRILFSMFIPWSTTEHRQTQ